MNQKTRIHFLPFSITAEVAPGTTLLAAAHSVGIPLRSSCGAAGTCGKCAVYIDFSDTYDPKTAKKVFACREKIADANLTVFVPPDSLQRQSAQIVVDSQTGSPQTGDFQGRLRIVPVELSPPSREDHRSDFARLADALPLPVALSRCQLQTLPEKLRQTDWKGAAVFLDDSFLDFVDATESQKPFYAVALDIGTTTLAAQLVPLESGLEPEIPQPSSGRVNPQKKFGDDIISRIQKVIDLPEELGKLQETVLETVREMIAELSSAAQIGPEKIPLVTVSGNTVMQQIFLGIDPRPLGFSPFVPATNRYPLIPASEFALPIHPSGKVQTLPILGGFVGGDLVAGILATNLDQLANTENPALLIDIGTNGEMILAHKDRLYAAATAAGPAFEGARIRFGMIAAPGAIDRVEFGDSVHIHTIENVTPLGICGSGLIDFTAELLRSGVINSRGQFAKTETFAEPIQERLTTFEGKPAFRLSEKMAAPEIVFTQQDVRQVQLAAGAIRSGILLLLELAELNPSEIRSLFLGGGFGNFIRPENASRIGLFPPEIPVERIRFCGNTSLQGAKMLAADRNIATRIDSLLERTSHIDLSTLPNFTTLFGESMIFPEC